MEMGGIRTMDTSGINLTAQREPFNTYDARDECQNLARQQVFWKGIYDSPEQDPAYDGDNEKWWNERDVKVQAVRDKYNAFVINCIEEKRLKHKGEVQGYTHSWELDGKNYYARFEKKNTPASTKNLIGEVPNIFSITFEGPEGYDLTGKEGGKATAIYSRLLAAAKKVLDSGEVNGLYFSPADEKMALMYRKFFEDYMSKDFIQPQKHFYLKKSFLKERLASLPAEQRQKVYSQILSGNRDIRGELQRINQQKLDARNAFLTAKQYVGKVVGYRSGYSVIPAYVKAVNPNGRAEMYMYDTYSNRLEIGTWPIVTDRLAPTAFTDTKSIEPEKLERFMNLLRQKGVTV